MGRKTKYTKEIGKQLCLAHENGAPQKVCAELVGIDRKTLYNWLQEGKNQKRGNKKDFYKKWLIAHGKFKMFHLKNISDHAKIDWRASKYLLEVSDPDEFVIERKINAKQEIEHNGKININKSIVELEAEYEDYYTKLQSELGKSEKTNNNNNISK